MIASNHSWGSSIAVAALALLASCGGGDDHRSVPPVAKGGYVATALVTDSQGGGNPYASANVDSHLVNPWGIAFNPQGFVWVADNGTSTSTLYDGNGVAQTLVVTIPPTTAGSAAPTGIVFNATSGFAVSRNGVSGPSKFLFVSEAGTVSGWSPSVDLNNAITAVDNSATSKVYKGLALASEGTSTFLYAADFHNGTVDVFDSAFAPVVSPGAFVDSQLPASFAPFGIQAIGQQIYVAYAQRGAAGDDEVTGAGSGAVDVFDTAGVLLKRLVPAGGALNAPWGMAKAPANFGPFSNALIVGNFGDGRMNAFDAQTGAPLGSLSAPDGTAISIDGLWGIAFGNGINAQPDNALFFAAGPAGEKHGVYGRIDFR